MDPHNINEELTIHTIWLIRVPREKAFSEHMDAGYTQALAPCKLLAARYLCIRPYISGAGVK